MLKPRYEPAKTSRTELFPSRLLKILALKRALFYMREEDARRYGRVVREEERLWALEKEENRFIAYNNRYPHLPPRVSIQMKREGLRVYKALLKVWEALPAEERHIICDRCGEEKQALSIYSPICVDCQERQ